WALVWGSLTWPFFVAAQFLIQWITEKLSGGRFNTSVSKQLVILNAPIVILAVSIVTYQYIVSTPRSKFEKLIVRPIPESVRSIDQGGSRSMDSVFWVLRFEIDKPDFQMLLHDLKFVPV